jgi:HAD superfamily hydrolase (TIGR01490 family)
VTEHTTADPGSDTMPARPIVAAFDFDGTLMRGGSVFPFLVSVRGLLPVLAAMLRVLPKMAHAAVMGGSSADRAKEALFMRLLGGQEEARVNRIGVAFARQHLARRLRPEVRARLDWHRSQGHRVLVVSASPECYVRPAGEQLSVDGVLATRLASSGGILTGRYEGLNCRGAEKYTRLTAWLRSQGLSGNGSTPVVLWAYGNSRGDLRLLDAADHGVDAGRLGRLGALRRFAPLSSLREAPSGD